MKFVFLFCHIYCIIRKYIIEDFDVLAHILDVPVSHMLYAKIFIGSDIWKCVYGYDNEVTWMMSIILMSSDFDSI